MAKQNYVPLDLELLGNERHNPSLASTSTGFRTIEEHEAAARQEERSAKRRRTLTISILGSLFLLLVLLAALTTKPFNQLDSTTGPGSSSSNGTSSAADVAGTPAAAAAAADDDGGGGGMPAKGVWNEGGEDFAHLAQPGPDFVPCKGPNLQCAVINRLPVPESDFRNLSRRATSTGGMVAADNSRCSQIGRDVMFKGGNAADASVAVALCLGVVNPVSSGLGGGAFILARWNNGSSSFIDGRETAPAAARADMFAGLPANASLTGPLAVAVPGELQGLGQLWRAYGSQPWAYLVAPAAALARSGFAAHPYLVYVMSGPMNRARIQAIPALREAFMIQAANGSWRLPHVGELCCRRPKLADTLDKIASEGPSYLNNRQVAATMAGELAAAGGIISPTDLAAAAATVREPLRAQLGDLELLLPPPPSSAAVVAFALKFLAGYTTGNATQSFGGGASKEGGLGLHRLVEAMKHGFAIRTALGDPGTPDLPFSSSDAINAAVADLLNDTFIDQLRNQTRDDGVLPDTDYGGRWNPEGVAPAPESGTSHFSVVDKDRNAVSITSSVNTPFGSGVVSESTGILFGNTMDDFAQPNKSSVVTPHPSEANFIEPGKRPLSAMSPIIVTHKASGRLVAVAGGSGGPLIVSATLQTLARLLLEGADVREAVLSPRIHDQLLPRDDTYYENYTWGYTEHKLDPASVAFLQSKGQVATAGGFSIGVSQAIAVDYGSDGSRQPALGVLIGQSDSRKDGAPAGY